MIEQPHFQYVRTPDGVSIAYRMIGDGRPVLGVATGPWGIGVAFEDRGEQEMKGVGEPVRLWAVGESA